MVSLNADASLNTYMKLYSNTPMRGIAGYEIETRLYCRFDYRRL